jgi:hypothetical protein
MVGQYLIVRKVVRAQLLKALMSSDDNTTLEVVVIERGSKEKTHTFNLVISAVTRTKHSKDIGFSGYVKLTGRRFTAAIHSRKVGNNFGMFTFALPIHQQVLTLVQGSTLG